MSTNLFNILVTDFMREFDAELSGSVLHDSGVDAQAGPFTLHIREHDGLLTAFVPLAAVEPCALAGLGDWPVLNLSPLGPGRDALLWTRDWLDHLDGAALALLIERLLRQAEVLQSHSASRPEVTQASLMI